MKITSGSPRRFAPMFVMAVMAVVSAPAAAANAAMPDGSWRQTCEDASIRNGMLHARCRQDNGKYRSTSALLQDTCQGYSNRNGQLYCERGGGKQANSRWGGSFDESCHDISVDKNGRLSATCRRANGKSNRTNLTPGQCPSYRAGNDDGRLVCETQGHGNAGGSWQGSYRESCRDISTNSSGTLTATCQAMNGSWQRTSLAAVNCTDNRASNNNGQLVCESQRVGKNRWNGSFEQSCRDIYMDPSGMLTATCQTSNGQWVPSRLAARGCEGYRAGNNNGQLVCESQGQTSIRWEGSFAQSCRDVSMNSSGTLTASCQTMSGNWQRTSLDARNCSGYRAGNNNGQLVCESQGQSSNRWQGSFAQSCREVSTNSSGTLTASCQTMSGNWQRTSLDARNCSGYRAGNSNGQLVCER